MKTIMDLAILAAKFLVGIWPVMFLALLIGIAKRQSGFGAVIRSSTKALIVTWGLFAVLKSVFFLMKMDTFHLFAEPLDTRLFLGIGLLLFPFEVALLLEEKRKKFTASTLEDIRSLSPLILKSWLPILTAPRVIRWKWWVEQAITESIWLSVLTAARPG
jgi:hypothetical protein